MKTWTQEDVKRIFELYQQTPTDERIKQKICRALVALYERQTEDEQSTETTSTKNGIGFNGIDAPILTSLAKFYQERGFLTPKQVDLAAKRLQRYTKQLAHIANQQQEVHQP